MTKPGELASEWRLACRLYECPNRAHDPAPLCWDHLLDAWRFVEARGHREHVEQTIEWLHNRNRGPRYVPPGFVYYVRLGNGDIKIGTTTMLKQRMQALHLWLTDVLAVEPGGRDVERQRHLQFAEERLSRSGRGAQREDFEPSERLIEHIAEVARQYPDLLPGDARPGSVA